MRNLQTPDGGRIAVQRKSFSAPAGWMNYLSAGGGVVPLVDFNASYATMYSGSPWVYIAVNKLSKGVGYLPLKTYDMVGDEREVVRPGTDRKGKLARLLAAPCPDAKFTPTRFKRFIEGSRALFGNALLVKSRPSIGAPPNELLPVPWWRVQDVARDGFGRITEFRVSVDNGPPLKLRPQDVVHLPVQSPVGFLGVSPLESLRRTLGTEDAAQRETIAAFRNANRVGGMFTTPKKIPEDVRNAAEAQLTARYGGPDNAYKTAILSGVELNWVPTTFNHTEAQLVPIRKLSREEVAAAFDIPAPLINILDHATYSNIDTQHAMWYQDTLGPELVDIEEGLEEQLVEPEPQWQGLDLEFDLSEVLKGDITKRADALLKFLRMGFTVDEIRHIENRPPLNTKLSRTAWVDANLQQIGTTNGEEPDIEEEPDAGPGGFVPQVAEAASNGHTDRERVDLSRKVTP